MKKLLVLFCLASCSVSHTTAFKHCPTGKGFGQMIFDESCLSCTADEKVLTAPNGKGMSCCPNGSDSVAWNGEAYVCCGDGLVATVVPDRDDSICCPAGTKEAVWNKSKGFLAYSCSTSSSSETYESVQKKHCPTGKGFGQMIFDESCLSCTADEKVLTAPNRKGMSCCPNGSDSVAWNGEAYVCCGDGLVATVVPDRDDSICCPAGTKEAVWNKSKGFLAYSCSTSSSSEVYESVQKKHCPTGKGFGQMIFDESCLSCTADEKVLTAPNGKGMSCCPNGSDSVAWNGEAYVCCGDGLVATVVPERDDSICCPAGTKEAVWNKSKGFLAYSCGQ